MSRRLHLRRRSDALYPPRRMCRLRRLRAGLSGRGHLLRGRCAGRVGRLHPGQRRLLRRSRVAGRCVQNRQAEQGRPGDRRPSADGGGELTPQPTAPVTQLPDFPWDSLLPARTVAAAHPEGLVDLSVGTPVDRVPLPVRTALGDAHGVPDLDPVNVLPTIGSKELVASLPTQLGLRAGDVVVIPELAYPTYEIGAIMAGATAVRSDSLTALGPERISLIWINSPSNPTGRVL